MKVVNKTQNTHAWKEWRGMGLGASDAPIVMGDSPWMTPFELWLDKTGIKGKPEANAFAVVAMRRGVNLEPVARKMFEEKMGYKFPPTSAEDEDYAFLRASFDGYCEELNAIVEIKCPGKEDHSKAVKGKVPSKYMAQLQQQLSISGAKVCYYFSWDGESKEGALVEVLPDKVYQEQLFENMVKFWQHVIKKVPPDVTKKDLQNLVKEQRKALKIVEEVSNVFDILSKEDK